jgi:hypothetical protein
MSFGQRAASISWLAALVGKLDPQGRKPRYESGRDRRRLPFWCGSVTLRPKGAPGSRLLRGGN